MKKLMILLLALCTSMSVSACSNDDNNGNEPGAELPVTAVEPANESNTLVIYFTRTGNTEQLATHISELTGADVHRITETLPYPEDYNATVDRGRTERDNNARPGIANPLTNIDNYETVFVGFPVWFRDRPMIIATLLESYDFAGKTVIPFCTSASSGAGEAFGNVATAVTGATVREGLHVSSGQIPNARATIETWLTELEIIGGTVIPPVDPPTEQPNILVAYFSATGTTHAIAERISELTGAELYRIEPTNPYPANPYDVSMEIQAEAYNDMRPAISNLPESLDEYDVIYVGSPIWWHQPAMVVATFLDNYDLSGKTIIPFFTYGATTYLNESMQKIYRLTPNSVHIPATLPEDLDPENIQTPQNDDAGIEMPRNANGVEAWLNSLGVTY